jgi:hypothetical protein
MNDRQLQIKETQRSQSNINNNKRSTPSCIIVRCSKIEDKEKIPQEAKGKTPSL